MIVLQDLKSLVNKWRRFEEIKTELQGLMFDSNTGRIKVNKKEFYKRKDVRSRINEIEEIKASLL